MLPMRLPDALFPLWRLWPRAEAAMKPTTSVRHGGLATGIATAFRLRAATPYGLILDRDKGCCAQSLNSCHFL